MITIKENELYIDADENQYTVKRYLGTDKDGEIVWRYLSYHQTLKEALKSIIRHKQYQVIMDGDFTLAQALEEFKKIDDEFSSLLEDKIMEGEN